VAFAFGGLALTVVALGLGLRAVSELNLTMTEQYHTAADPFVLLAAAVTLGSIWNAGRGGRGGTIRRVSAIAVVAGFVAFNVAHWPPVAPAGSWADAQAAATRIERNAPHGRLALVPLWEEKGADAYSYPLIRDGITLVAPDEAQTVVLLCETGWTSEGCGGDQEARWLRSNSGGAGLTLIDRFQAAPGRLMSVYGRDP
jgi:hypothetical protein